MLKKGALILTLLLTNSCTDHQSFQNEYDLVISNVNVVNVENGTITSNANIAIFDSKIIKITTKLIDTRRSTQSIDAGGAYATPGYTNAHVHSFSTPHDSAINSDKDYLDFYNKNIIPQFNKFVEQGFTTIVDPGGFLPYATDTRDQIEQGNLIAPRIYTVGKVIDLENGHFSEFFCQGREWCKQHLFIEINETTDIKSVITQLYAQGVDAIKVTYDSSFRNGLNTYDKLNDEHVKKIIDVASNIGLPVLSHTTHLKEYIDITSFGINGFFHGPTPVDGKFIYDGQDFLSQVDPHLLPLVSCYFFLAPSLKHENEQEQHQIDLTKNYTPAIRQLINSGYPIIFGSDFFAGVVDRIPLEIEAMQALGFSHLEILQSLTMNAQHLPFINIKMGQIKQDYMADILLFSNNPLNSLDDLFKPKLVIKSGEVLIRNIHIQSN
ncbi:hypothetical protein SOPP22_19430 [Shewanella sp. OPT22]|nr:hypothetical protein SOPP22_19430 [Shewanella sp. OPT22]